MTYINGHEVLAWAQHPIYYNRGVAVLVDTSDERDTFIMGAVERPTGREWRLAAFPVAQRFADRTAAMVAFAGLVGGSWW